MKLKSVTNSGINFTDGSKLTANYVKGSDAVNWKDVKMSKANKALEFDKLELNKNVRAIDKSHIAITSVEGIDIVISIDEATLAEVIDYEFDIRFNDEVLIKYFRLKKRNHEIKAVNLKDLVK